MRRIAVIGGGISGLATAYRIRAGLTAAGVDHELTVYEAGAEAAGKIRTERVGGFLVESGPNGWLDNEPATERLVTDLGLLDRLVPASAESKTRFLFRRGRLVPLPTSPPRFLLSPLLSRRGRLRVPWEYFVPPTPDAARESVHEFVTRRLGREATEGLIDAMVSGIYAGDTRALSIAAAFPRIVELEQQYGGLLRGQIALARERKARGEEMGPTGQPRGSLTSFGDGMDVLVRTLATQLADHVRTGVRVTALRRDVGDYVLDLEQGEEVNSRRYFDPQPLRVSSARADAVVVAVPAPAAAGILRGLVPAASDALDSIPYAGVAVLGLGFRREDVGHDLQGFGFLAPRREGLRSLGVRCASSTFPGRAPAGHVLLEALIGGAHDPLALCEQTGDLVDLVLDGLRAPLDLRAAPAMVVIYRHRQAIPQYTLGHLDRVANLEAAIAEHPGLAITGNALKGVAMNRCVAESEAIAAAICSQLSGT